MQTLRIILAVLSTCIAPAYLAAQTATALMPVAKLQFLDTNGVPLAGGKVYTYAAGTTTPLLTYTDSSGNIPNTDPIILDSGGFANVWMGTSAYKIVVQDANGVQQWSQDNVVSVQGLLTGPNGASIVNYLQGGPNSVIRTVQSRLRDFVSVKDFGTTGNGTSDDQPGIQACLNYVYGTPETCYFPAGTYKLISSVSSLASLRYRGESLAGQGKLSTTIIGAPGKDVFEQLEPDDPAYQGTLQDTHISGLTILVDGTVDAHASFPNRIAGQGTKAGYVWNIGNCAIAMPDRDGNFGGSNGLYHWIIENVRIDNISGSSLSNHTCGVFLQGNAGLYDSHVHGLEVRNQNFGFMYVPSVVNQNPLLTADANLLSNLSILCPVPFVWYDGANNVLDTFQVYATNQPTWLGPFIVASGGAHPPQDWVISGMFVEAGGYTGEFAQIDGADHTVLSSNWKGDQSSGSIVWNASTSRMLGTNIGTAFGQTSPNIIVNGDRNQFQLRIAFGSLGYNVVQDNGHGNVIQTVSTSFAPQREYSATRSQPRPFNALDSGFLQSGSSQHPYASGNDLLLTVDDLDANQCGAIVSDTTALAWRTCQINSGTGALFQNIDGLPHSLTYGDRVPKTLVEISIRAKAAAPITDTFTVFDSGGATIASTALSVGTSFSVQSLFVDLSSATGQYLLFSFSAPSSTMQVDWVAFQPWPQDYAQQIYGQQTIPVSNFAISVDPRRGPFVNVPMVMPITNGITITSPYAGEQFTLHFCQTIGGKSVTWPAQFVGATPIDLTVNACTTQSFVYDGTNYVATTSGVSSLLDGLPTISAGAGAGTSPTVSINSSSTTSSGSVAITTGTAPATNSLIATITFIRPQIKSVFCTVSPANNSSLSAGGAVVLSTPSNSSLSIYSGSAALSATTLYQFTYVCR